MFLTRCPNCDHDNTPGERFCAACGVPLNLRPCPRCGKVDQVTAKVCTGCGAPFPPIASGQTAAAPMEALAGLQAAPRPAPGTVREPTPAAARVAAAKPAPAAPPQPPASSPLQPATPPAPSRAWPLIVVAIVAGGIPLLWMNRTHLPSPKAWQIQPPSIPGAAAPVEPTPVPALIAPPVAPPAPTTEVPSTEKLAEKVADPPETAAAAPSKPKAPARAPQRKRPAETAAPKAAAPAGPCTEALAALGLCDPKAPAK